MQVIALASQKGGSGKTTVAGHLAVEAGRAGYGPVALIDADPQGSLAGWWKQRSDPLPSLVRSDSASIDNDLQQLYEQGHRLVVIDTPPAATSAISEIVRVADLVIVPCRPSPHDLRAVGATVDIVERWNKPLVFAVNSATRRARITSEAAVALSQHGTVAPVTLHHRVDFAASMIDGRTVMETAPESASAKEVMALWEYIAERLAKITGPTVAPEDTEDSQVEEVLQKAVPMVVPDERANPSVPAQMQAQVQSQMQATQTEVPVPASKFDPEDEYDEDDEAAEAPSEPSVLEHTGNHDAAQKNPAPAAAPAVEETSPAGHEAPQQPQQRPGFGAPVHRPSFGRRRFASERS